MPKSRITGTTGGVFCEEILEGLVDLLVSAYEGRLFCTHFHAKLSEAVVEVPVGFHGLLGHSVWCCGCGVVADIIHPAG